MNRIRYTFEFAGGRREEFDLRFDESFRLLVPGDRPLPEWTRQQNNRCANCPLPPNNGHCPLAAALADPVERLGGVISYEEMRVEVVMPERTVWRQTTAQDGISALLGLINATSGCPVTAFLRPMARFHLPFATEAETLYRAASMYLLGEYFRNREGFPADLELQGLLVRYRELETVNRGIVARIRSARSEDGSLNAMVLLDLYAKSFPFAVEESLAELRPFFAAYLE